MGSGLQAGSKFAARITLFFGQLLSGDPHVLCGRIFVFHAECDIDCPRSNQPVSELKKGEKLLETFPIERTAKAQIVA